MKRTLRRFFFGHLAVWMSVTSIMGSVVMFVELALRPGFNPHIENDLLVVGLVAFSGLVSGIFGVNELERN